MEKKSLFYRLPPLRGTLPHNQTQRQNRRSGINLKSQEHKNIEEMFSGLKSSLFRDVNRIREALPNLKIDRVKDSSAVRQHNQAQEIFQREINLELKAQRLCFLLEVQREDSM